jgi:hypothetical protein
LYAGRIYTSRAERRIDQLLGPLLLGLRQTATRGTLSFIGNLSIQESDELASWRPAYSQAGWNIAVGSCAPRAEALDRMRKADGLVLLSSSHASIPAKLFEYVQAQRPILAITPPGSAVASLARDIRQLFVVDHNKPESASVGQFISACLHDMECSLPDRFSEEHLRTVFLTALGHQFEESK